eukprot:Skav211396  [mRNA]  locus=scaffold1467:82463:83500:- [translate_table: standard]
MKSTQNWGPANYGNQGWQCEKCGAWNGKGADFCQKCGSHWEVTGWVGGVPKDRRWKWQKGKGDASQSPRPRKRDTAPKESKPPSKPKGPRGKKEKKEKESETPTFTKPSPFSHTVEQPLSTEGPPFVNLGGSPWNPQPGTAAASSAAANQELVQALKSAYSATPDSMPQHVKDLLAKTEEENEKLLTKRLHKAAADFGRARKSLGEVSEARKAHRLRWLRHMKESIGVWETQLDDYRKVQANLREQAAKANTEISNARKTIAQLNTTGKVADLPPLEELEEKETENVIDNEEQELRAKVGQLLAACASAAGVEAKPGVDEISSEDLTPPVAGQKRHCAGTEGHSS